MGMSGIINGARAFFHKLGTNAEKANAGAGAELAAQDIQTATHADTIAVAAEQAAVSSLKRQLEASRLEVAQHQADAEMAARAQNMDLARRALASKIAAQASVTSLETQVASAEAKLDKDKAFLTQAQVQAEMAKNKATGIAAEHDVLTAQAKVQTTLGTGSGSAMDRLNRLGNYTDDERAKQDALAQLDPGAVNNSMVQLRTNAAVDDEMAKLMVSVNGTPAPVAAAPPASAGLAANQEGHIA